MWVLFVLITVLLFGADQWTKWIALEKLSNFATASGVPHGNMPPVTGIPHIIEFTYESNLAGAMGISFPWARHILSIATLVLLVVLAVYIIKNGKKQPLLLCASTLLFAGGIGNLVDRVFRGYVPDFIRFVYHKYFPYVFNVADIYVCIGAVLLGVFILWFDMDKSVKRGETDGRDL